MTLDIRLPIGMLFATLGTLLGLYGLWGDKAIYARSLGINVNLYWGLAMLAFGIIMSWMGIGGARRPAATTPPTEAQRRPGAH
jgi:hypothetical protein